MSLPIFLYLLSFVKFTGPTDASKSDWEKLNQALKPRLAQLHQQAAHCDPNHPDEVEQLGDSLSLVIREFFVEHEDFFLDEASKVPGKKYVAHNNQTIAQLDERKKILRREAFGAEGSEEKRKEFYLCIQAISEMKQIEKKKQELKSTAYHEKQFHRSRYRYSKQIVSDTFGKADVQPSYDKQTADHFYSNSYSHHKDVDFTQLHWFPNLPTSPQSNDFTQFNTTPFRPRDIRSILTKSNKKSAPGPDGITYMTLLKLDCTHHILATFFNKVFTSGAHPPSWGESVVKLLHKKGDSSDPSNFRMIALTGCIGKAYHLLLTERLTTFLTANKFIDPELQKAFLPGINGCIEHNLVMEEVIKDAKSKNRTCHITFFDLEDAFGSVPHSLIDHTLERNFVPPVIRKYLHNLYSHSTAVVESKPWRSDPFKFNRGVFQGDPISPVIFLLVFNPILQELQRNSHKGYKLGDTSIVTLPYADDFCLISTHIGTHQNTIDKINSQVSSMGMKLKPSKCRSFSLRSGKPEAIHFNIGENIIPSIRDEEQKFWGKLLFFQGKSEETFQYISDILNEGIERIGKSMVRKEYKLWIYANYFLPSKRFLLTVHTLTQTQLKTLDTLTDKAIKIWAGVPRSATNAVIHMKEALDIKSISQLYTETHTVSHVRTRLQADSTVNNVIDSTLEREGEWTTKRSTTVDCEDVFVNSVQLNTAEDDIPEFTGDNAAKLKHNFNISVRNTAKSHIVDTYREEDVSHVKSLAVQGKTLVLAAAEATDFTWKSFLYDMKAGTLKFLVNSVIDTLPTAANLVRWSKSNSDKCKLCKGRQTTDHCLNICKVGLDTGRWTWRHNNIVNYVVNSLDTQKFSVHSDIPGHEANGGGTIPPEVCITNLKPDITIWDKTNKKFHIFELTCPLMTNIDKQHEYKTNKYAHFLTDISHLHTSVTAFEITSTGHITQRNHTHLQALHKFCKPGIKLGNFKKNISGLSIYSSYHIWLCRSDPLFQEPPFLPPPFPDRL